MDRRGRQAIDMRTGSGMQRDLVLRAGTGDHDASASLATDAYGRLHRTARLILRREDLASDAVQEALTSAWLHIWAVRDPDSFEITCIGHLTSMRQSWRSGSTLAAAPSGSSSSTGTRSSCGPFDAVLRSEGMRVIRTPVRAPNANAYAERVIETLRAECLDWTLIWGRRHLDRTLRTYADHYNRAAPTPRPRPRLSRSQRPGSRSRPTRATSAGGTCSVGSSTSTAGRPRDRIGVSDPHGMQQMSG